MSCGHAYSGVWLLMSGITVGVLLLRSREHLLSLVLLIVISWRRCMMVFEQSLFCAERVMTDGEKRIE